MHRFNSNTISFRRFRRMVNKRLGERNDANKPFCLSVWRKDLARALFIRTQRGETGYLEKLLAGRK